MTSKELAVYERASLDRALRRALQDVLRLETAIRDYTPWSPPQNLPRNEQGILTLEISDPFEVGGSARGTRYERVFDLASVGAAEPGEPFNLQYGGMSVTARPGESPDDLRKAYGTSLGEWISPVVNYDE